MVAVMVAWQMACVVVMVMVAVAWLTHVCCVMVAVAVAWLMTCVVVMVAWLVRMCLRDGRGHGRGHGRVTCTHVCCVMVMMVAWLVHMCLRDGHGRGHGRVTDDMCLRDGRVTGSHVFAWWSRSRDWTHVLWWWSRDWWPYIIKRRSSVHELFLNNYKWYKWCDDVLFLNFSQRRAVPLIRLCVWRVHGVGWCDFRGIDYWHWKQ